jgi:Tol biopolymer transport system component
MLKRVVTAIVLVSVWVAASPIPSQATFPGRNGAIAFTRNGHVWAIQPSGAQVKLAKGSEPAWSPDGTRIAYLRPGRRVGQIWTMAADGTDRIPVLTDFDFFSAPSWSPDGTQLVFSGRGQSGPANHDLYTIAAEPPFGEAVPITDTPEADEEFPAWSPDGTRIAFGVLGCPSSCGDRIGVIDPDGANYTLLTPETFDDGLHPDWSPDSTTLLFESNRNDPDHFFDFDIYSIPSTGGAVTRITRAPGDARNATPSWSPDGTRFAYVHESRASRVTLRTAVLDGSSVVRLCRVSSFFDEPPDWQPII